MSVELNLGSHQHQNEMVLPLENVKNAAAIAWDATKNYIFWSDVATKTINRAFWNGSDHVVIAHTNICKSKTNVGYHFNSRSWRGLLSQLLI